MSYVLRSIVTLALLLCLPLQGLAAAAALPMAMTHGEPQVVAAASTDHAMHHCAQGAHDTQPAKSGTTCDKCFSCHISIAQALMPYAAGFAPNAAGIEVGGIAADKPATLIFPFFRPPISA